MKLFNKTKTKPKVKSSSEAQMFKCYTLKDLRADKFRVPEDIIVPRVLTPGGTVVLGGSRLSGATDLLLNWLAHLAVGKPFLGMTPPRPLKIAYLQGENGYHYLCERMQKLQIEPELMSLFRDNLFFTSRIKTPLDKEGVDLMKRTILYHMRDGVDIIAINPLYIFFGDHDMGSWVRLREFERDVLEVLRDAVNPKSGVILLHETKNLSKQQMEEDAFYGFDEVRTISTTDISMLSSDANASSRTLHFALNYGAPIKTKTIDKIDGKWCEVSPAVAKKKAA